MEKALRSLIAVPLVFLVSACAVSLAMVGCSDTRPTDGAGSSSGEAASGDSKTGGSGSSASNSGDGNTATSTSPSCPGTASACDGACVDVQRDPENCGACGNQCSSDQVCSLGRCTDDCDDDLEACGSSCVDTELDSQNCGECGTECGAGQGCVDGDCEDLAGSNTQAKSCTNGGPPIYTGKGTGDAGTCTGNVAKRTFRWALCSCDGVRFGNEFYTDGFDSRGGPYNNPGPGGGVGSNGPMQGGNSATIRGALWTSSPGGVDVGNSLEVSQQLHSQGGVEVGNSGRIGDDTYSAGLVFAGNSLSIDETLYLDPQANVRGDVSYSNLVEQSVDVGTVCKRCEESSRIPVGEIVDRHESPNNDNDTIGLSPDVMASHSSNVDRLDLPCGEYYFSEIAVDNSAEIVAHGNAAIYIDGDVEIGNGLTIKPVPGATLDIFIAGDVRAGNSVELGDALRPSSTRVYVGGSDGWDFGNSAEVGAYLYAIPGGIRGGNSLDLYGGLYTQFLQHGNSVEIHYDRHVLESGDECPDPDSGGGSGGSDGSGGDDGDGGGDDGGGSGGSADGGDGSAPDAGSFADTGGGGSSGGGSGGDDEPQCRDQGGSCSADGDCCAPLVCDDGTCSVVECKTLGAECSSDSDCCSGVCASSTDSSSCVGG